MSRCFPSSQMSPGLLIGSALLGAGLGVAAYAAGSFAPVWAQNAPNFGTPTLRLDKPQPRQQLSLPVWIPGSYLVREFSKNLQGLQARQGKRRVAVRQLDKHRWQLNGHQPGQPVTVRGFVRTVEILSELPWDTAHPEDNHVKVQGFHGLTLPFTTHDPSRP